MKIGKFTMQNNITIDAVRHYIELGLIIPEKSGGQYDFDERCKSDLEKTIKLKGQGFTLNEIKAIFVIKRIGKLTTYQENEYYRDIYCNKKIELSSKIKELERFRDKLEETIEDLSKIKCMDNFKIGIDIEALKLFSCLKCGKELILSDGIITNNQVMEGNLKCTCGEDYKIEDGILLVGSVQSETNLRAQSETNLDIVDYVNSTDSEYLENVYSGLEYMNKKIQFEELNNKIILEIGSGAGFFLRSIYTDLPDDSLYIAVDNDLNRHKFLKSMLQKSEYNKRVIFLCCDFLKMPLKDNLVDVLIDFNGTSNYSFEHEEFLLNLIDKSLKRKLIMIAAYITFNNFSIDSSIIEKVRKNFILKSIKNNILNLQYNIIDEKTSKSISKGGKYENYFKCNEGISSYIVYAKR
ncbi:MerR family transcriptional regulator [Clostridium tagluense]|uniref:MerR family transcriptional regulator n=1 Tax=Clostridium tagluense TaxID=360422 RepID=UPI001C6DEF5B|nr:MerR family transcriptional regulator [Clostridium tagluense]MBW9158014.1 methyltransferase domain-containing protein [Clostridium tagluense]WLC66445.1 MerR family transcriptional regulator [Clostridium tagluense]